jgi:hypothetical protein
VAKRIPRTTSNDDLKRFFHSIGGSDSCWRCGHSDWAIGNSDEDGGAALHSTGWDGKVTDRIMEVLPLVCENCGNVWLVWWGHIRQWLSENPENFDGDRADG